MLDPVVSALYLLIMSKQYKYGYSICKNYSIFMFKILKPFTHEVILNTKSTATISSFSCQNSSLSYDERSLYLKHHSSEHFNFLNCFKIEAFKHIWLLFLFVCLNFLGFFVCVFCCCVKLQYQNSLFTNLMFQENLSSGSFQGHLKIQKHLQQEYIRNCYFLHY